MNERNMIRLPKGEEVETVKAKAKEVFANLEIELDEIKTESDGRMLTRAVIPQEKKNRLLSDLFAYGILIVEVGNGELGFAVRT